MTLNHKKIEKAQSIQIEKWVPAVSENWPSKQILKVGYKNKYKDDFLKDIKKYSKKKKWVLPKKPVHFISDLHADADALFKSLIGAGLIAKTGPMDHEFEVLDKAHQGSVIIGGDCLDKGPSNLRLLDSIKLVKDAGIDLKIIAGNHDIRTFVGLAIGEDRQTVAEHMFVRMGKKTIPLFREIYKKYLHKKIDSKSLLSQEEVEKKLFPSSKWFKTYAEKMDGLIPPKKIEREADRVKEKITEINEYLSRTGFTHGMLYATTEKAKDIFLNPQGEYGWFFSEMNIALQEGSFLFVHAGLDDFSTDWIGQVGVDGLNEKFKILMRNNPFELYHGHIGNIFRTKYRDTDFPFSPRSAKKMHQMGINAIVHGHRNTTQGHRIVIKRGLLNFECDTSLDRKTRKIEKLEGYGASWFTIDPDGTIEAFSTDYPAIKQFKIEKMGGKITNKLPRKKDMKMKSEKFDKKSKVKIKTTENLSQLRQVFESIGDDLGNGILQIQGENDKLLTKLPNDVSLTVESNTSAESGEISFTISWGKDKKTSKN